MNEGSKYKAALEKKVKIMSDIELYDMIDKSYQGDRKPASDSAGASTAPTKEKVNLSFFMTMQSLFICILM